MKIKLIIFIFLILSYFKLNSDSYICTWVYCDSKEEESIFPNTGTNLRSSDATFQKMYWECASVMMTSSLRFNKDTKHIIFTNKTIIPETFNSFLKRHSIQIITIPMKYQTPKNYYNYFRNTFYLLDLIKYMSKITKENDKIIFLDSDCVWIKPATQIFKEIEKNGFVNFYKSYQSNYNINGLTRDDCKEIYSDLLNTPIEKAPKHFSGGIHAFTGIYLKKAADEIDYIWENMMQRFKKNKKKFTTEEHVLSFLYYKLNPSCCGIANQYLKIIWTSYENYTVSGDEKNYTIWHLPTAKNKGFTRLFNYLNIKRSYPFELSNERFIQYCSSHLFQK